MGSISRGRAARVRRRIALLLLLGSAMSGVAPGWYGSGGLSPLGQCPYTAHKRVFPVFTLSLSTDILGLCVGTHGREGEGERACLGAEQRESGAISRVL